jgi:hypothetical protein
MRTALAALAFVVAAGGAQARTERCLLEVDGEPYILGRCNVDREKDGSFSIGTGGRGVGSPFFAYLNKDEDGTATASWNETAGSTHAHTDLGTLKQWGACWMNGKAKICAWK